MTMGAMTILLQQYGSDNNDNTNFTLLEGHDDVSKQILQLKNPFLEDIWFVSQKSNIILKQLMSKKINT